MSSSTCGGTIEVWQVLVSLWGVLESGERLNNRCETAVTLPPSQLAAPTEKGLACMYFDSDLFPNHF